MTPELYFLHLLLSLAPYSPHLLCARERAPEASALRTGAPAVVAFAQAYLDDGWGCATGVPVAVSVRAADERLVRGWGECGSWYGAASRLTGGSCRRVPARLASLVERALVAAGEPFPEGLYPPCSR